MEENIKYLQNRSRVALKVWKCGGFNDMISAIEL
jgi:hypothetical protein